MTQSPVTVTYSLEDFLTRLEQKLDKQYENINQKIDKLDGKVDKLDERLTKLEIGQAEIRGDLKALDERLSGQITAIDSRLKTVEITIQKIPDLAEKVRELKNLRQIAVITVTAVITSVVI